MVNFHKKFVVALQLWKYKNILMFWYIMLPWWFFSKIQKIVFKNYAHILWLLISCFHPIAPTNGPILYTSTNSSEASRLYKLP
jgi:hypothetical protein